MTAKTTVLHIAPSIHVMGGISAVLKYLLDTSLAQEHRLLFVASHKDGSKLKKLLAAILGLLKMLALLLCQRIDIVHIHCGDFPSPIRKYFYFRVARLMGHKVLLHLHGAMFMEQYARLSPGWKRRIRDFFESAELVICLSQSWKKSITSIFPMAKCVVVPNGIPLPPLGSPKTGPTDQSTPVRITFLGLIGTRKGTFDLLTAFKSLLEQGLPIVLTLGGNGEVARLMHEIEPLGHHARYLGWVSGEAKAELLRATDIFALPSHGEGMPMSVLEAMSYGIPIVSTPVGGIPELVAEGESGFLVPPGDTIQLARRLGHLIADPDLRCRMGRAARMAVEQRHDAQFMAKQIAEAYRRITRDAATF